MKDYSSANSKNRLILSIVIIETRQYRIREAYSEPYQISMI